MYIRLSRTHVDIDTFSACAKFFDSILRTFATLLRSNVSDAGVASKLKRRECRQRTTAHNLRDCR